MIIVTPLIGHYRQIWSKKSNSNKITLSKQQSAICWVGKFSQNRWSTLYELLGSQVSTYVCLFTYIGIRAYLHNLNLDVTSLCIGQ